MTETAADVQAGFILWKEVYESDYGQACWSADYGCLVQDNDVRLPLPGDIGTLDPEGKFTVLLDSGPQVPYSTTDIELGNDLFLKSKGVEETPYVTTDKTNYAGNIKSDAKTKAFKLNHTSASEGALLYVDQQVLQRQYLSNGERDRARQRLVDHYKSQLPNRRHNTLVLIESCVKASTWSAVVFPNTGAGNVVEKTIERANIVAIGKGVQRRSSHRTRAVSGTKSGCCPPGQQCIFLKVAAIFSVNYTEDQSNFFAYQTAYLGFNELQLHFIKHSRGYKFSIISTDDFLRWKTLPQSVKLHVEVKEYPYLTNVGILDIQDNLTIRVSAKIDDVYRRILSPFAISSSQMVGELLRFDVSENKNMIEGLLRQCAFLAYVAEIRSSDPNSLFNASIEDVRELGRMVRDLQDLLTTFREKFKLWAKFSSLTHILEYGNTRSTLHSLQSRIDEHVRKYRISVPEIAQFQTTSFQEKLNADNLTILAHLRTVVEEHVGGIEAIIVEIKNGNTNCEEKEKLIGLLGLCQTRWEYSHDSTEVTSLEETISSLKAALNVLPVGLRVPWDKLRDMSLKYSGDKFLIIKGKLFKDEVAVKVLRGVNTKQSKYLRRLLREANIWREVYEKDLGEYILPYWGVVETPEGIPGLISPWQCNGTAPQYIEDHKLNIRSKIVMFEHITTGVQFLHDWQPGSLLHGDIRGDNILINKNGNPVLADFSLAKITSALGQSLNYTASSRVNYALRWAAPEVIAVKPEYSTMSDIYSLGMTLIELVTEMQPFPDAKDSYDPNREFHCNPEMMYPRPQNVECPAALWELIDACISRVPKKRPKASAVQVGLRNILEQL